MERHSTGCSHCEKKFEVRFRYQVQETPKGFQYFCSQRCQIAALHHQQNETSTASQESASAACSCEVCTRSFQFEYPFQAVVQEGGVRHFCSMQCRTKAMPIANPTPIFRAPSHATTGQTTPQSARPTPRATVASTSSFTVPKPSAFVSSPGAAAAASDSSHATPFFEVSSPGAFKASAVAQVPVRAPRRIAVFNHKGGTGKTTTAVNLAAGLAQGGQRVLLIDADGQGNVGASLGIRGEKTLYHVLVQGACPEESAVPVRDNLDVLTSNELLAAAELNLATKPNRDRIMRDRLAHRVTNYDVVILDCAPALSLMNQNALVYADSVIIPVSCDYLSLVGVKQVLRTLRNVRDLLKHDVALLGVLPTFFDVRNKIARDAVAALTDHFGERCLPPIRVNTKLREAPTMRQTIFEYAPESHGALDYVNLVEFVKKLRGDATIINQDVSVTPVREHTSVTEKSPSPAVSGIAGEQRDWAHAALSV